MNMFFSMITILAFSIFVRQILRHLANRSNRFISILGRHLSTIVFIISIVILSIPIVLWLTFGGVIEFGGITIKFLASLLFSVLAAGILELMERSPLGKPSKVTEGLDVEELENVWLANRNPINTEAQIELDTLERNFVLTSSTRISFEAINRFGTQAEFAMLDREIDSIELDQTR
jgi:hypothetical protein